MEEFLQYMDLPAKERQPRSEEEDWPKSMQALVRLALEEYLAYRPLKTRSGPLSARKEKPKAIPKPLPPPPPIQPKRKGNYT